MYTVGCDGFLYIWKCNTALGDVQPKQRIENDDVDEHANDSDKKGKL